MILPLFPSLSSPTPADLCRILYQSRLHPSTPIPSLTEENLQTLHHWIRKVPEVAVGVNADSKFFPEDWLFRWRWGKGKKHDAMAKKAKAGLKGSWDPPVEVKKEGRGGGGGGDDENGGEDITPQGVAFLALVSPSSLHVMLSAWSAELAHMLTCSSARRFPCYHHIHRGRRSDHGCRQGAAEDAGRRGHQAKGQQRWKRRQGRWRWVNRWEGGYRRAEAEAQARRGERTGGIIAPRELDERVSCGFAERVS